MRNVYVLSLAQALSAAGMMTIFLLGGIIGSELAPLPQIATLPVSLTVVGLAVTAIPAPAPACQPSTRRSSTSC